MFLLIWLLSSLVSTKSVIILSLSILFFPFENRMISLNFFSKIVLVPVLIKTRPTSILKDLWYKFFCTASPKPTSIHVTVSNRYLRTKATRIFNRNMYIFKFSSPMQVKLYKVILQNIYKLGGHWIRWDYFIIVHELIFYRDLPTIFVHITGTL